MVFEDFEYNEINQGLNKINNLTFVHDKKNWFYNYLNFNSFFNVIKERFRIDWERKERLICIGTLNHHQ